MRLFLFLLMCSLTLVACATNTSAANETRVPVITSSATFTRAPASPTLAPPTLTLALTATATASPTLAPTATTHPPPTPDAGADKRQVRLPILMYHYIEPWPPTASALRQNLTVRPEDFAAQMAYLHEQGYSTLSLYDLMEALALGKTLPERAVVLTFDDGYRSLMDYAVPEMQKYNFTGTVFVITELMDREFEAYLTWPQAEALYAQGWKIEPHTKTHDELAGQGRDFQLYQLLGSMQTVEAHIGVAPRFFCYPAGKYDAVTLQLARELNLWGAVTTEPGRWHTLAEQFTLSRVRVDGQGTLDSFVAGLEGDL